MDRALAEKAEALADAIEGVVVPWLVAAATGAAGDTPVDRTELERAAQAAAADVVPRIRTLLATDIDAQVTTPLALLREAVGPVTAVLVRAGVPPVERDEFARRAFPEDAYALAPAAFEDVDPSLRGPGIEWGAAKAYVHLHRHRS